MQTNNGSSPRGSLRIALGVSLLLLAAGCSSRGAVSGKVFYEGKPLPGGKVLFIHEQKGSFTSRIQEDGSYKIPDVPTGQVKIAVTGPATGSDANDPRLALSMRGGKLPTDTDLAKLKKLVPSDVDEAGLREMMGVPAAQPQKSALIPSKYNDPEKSGLTYKVDGGPQTHDIKLESASKEPSP
jgi:hypothetical protein